MSCLRKTTQYELPVVKPAISAGQYDLYPEAPIEGCPIDCDYLSLAKALAGSTQVMIDGYIGVRFDLFAQALQSAFESLKIKPLWWNMQSAQKPAQIVEEMIAPFLGGEDPLFGKRTSLQLADFYEADALAQIRPCQDAPMNILIGVGAALAQWEGPLVYIDIPKNEIQFRARAASVTNLGADQPLPPKKMYKRFYFVDWVVLNRHKKRFLSQIDYYVDGQREQTITWTRGDALRCALQKMAQNGFRVRPWFEPGAWGGQWIRKHMPQLPQNVPNYAWSFELIFPENGLIFSHNNVLLETSADLVMFQAAEDVVGTEAHMHYEDEFPIRMDYLDNFDGGNLSIQCHPQRAFAQTHFGEVLTQEETYYILDTCPGAEVYLGFNEDIDPADFEKQLQVCARNNTPLDVKKFIHSEPSKQHNLYLIPPGTLHSSGRNNLVLEISTTPYIFTFKMYDWQAVDLDGKPRPLNIERAMQNLCFDRKGDKVSKELVAQPKLLEEGEGWELWHLATHKNHSYDVHRYRLTTTVEVQTNGKCHVLNLVEGEQVDVITKNGTTFHLCYAETLVICAAAESYKIVNTSAGPVQVVKAFIK